MKTLQLPLAGVLLGLTLSATGCSTTVKRPDGGEGLLPVGANAPDFGATTKSGDATRLSALKGQAVVVYFYPKDETPGCTKEACGFRDLTAEFEKAGAVILGVSNDPMETHLRFKEKQKLPFELLSDEDAAVSRAYGVYKQKNLYGKKSLGIERTTFIVDRTGRIAQIYPKVKVEGHVADVLAFLSEE